MDVDPLQPYYDVLLEMQDKKERQIEIREIYSMSEPSLARVIDLMQQNEREC